VDFKGCKVGGVTWGRVLTLAVLEALEGSRLGGDGDDDAED